MYDQNQIIILGRLQVLHPDQVRNLKQIKTNIIINENEN